ncbi:triose-phosphate isomerase [Rhodospirillaceae bacterium KN72]|uniref:Triosephosphate isomerase n=1 Tax=Pacificispira spongiicola TaxID=2729598 RepID=A0A7Y0DYN1_9PROT|nr:triose-phosphate isomerase [Pacificispira spongiicola]NMM44010.1 triose-phosphate isomerase [Pacificispira spongiicola]
MSRTPLIAGNWKMNGLLADGTALATAVAQGDASGCEILVCPPATLIHAVAQALKGSTVKLGGQDCHAAEKGAHTGDVSAAMLKDLRCSHVILGHSERRQDHGETDAQVSEKALAAYAAGLVAVICVGETEAERDAGDTMKVISAQLDGSVPKGATAENTVIAYEPVWAIGTGRTPTAEEANAVHVHIRAHLSGGLGADTASGMRILYGGSMKPGNAAELLAQSDIDGGLIGGAALKADDFLAIAAASKG